MRSGFNSQYPDLSAEQAEWAHSKMVLCGIRIAEVRVRFPVSPKLMASPKKKNKRQKIIVAVSGGFDPTHVGHVRLFNEAKKLGDELVVILNNDHWLKDKKGFVFIPQEERKEILEAIKWVDRVLITDHKPGEYFKDRSVCRSLRKIQPHIFANGGDRKPDGDPVPEVALCEELGIEMIYNVGEGGKIQSSSWLVEQAAQLAKNQRKS